MQVPSVFFIFLPSNLSSHTHTHIQPEKEANLVSRAEETSMFADVFHMKHRRFSSSTLECLSCLPSTRLQGIATFIFSTGTAHMSLINSI